MTKPTVFNYQDYVALEAEILDLREENDRLKEKVANLEIRCRIAEGAPVESLNNLLQFARGKAWIPVSERLPEYRRVVLVSSYWGVTVAIRDAVKEDGTDDFWSLLLEDADTGTRYIYAWRPLPEPYREDGEA